MIYKEVSSNLEFLSHYMVRVFCLQGYMYMYNVHICVSSFQFILLLSYNFVFLATRPYVHSVEFIHFTKLHITFKNSFYGTD